MWVPLLATGIPIYDSMILTPECPNRPNQMDVRNSSDTLETVVDALESVTLESVDDALESTLDAPERIDNAHESVPDSHGTCVFLIHYL